MGRGAPFTCEPTPWAVKKAVKQRILVVPCDEPSLPILQGELESSSFNSGFEDTSELGVKTTMAFFYTCAHKNESISFQSYNGFQLYDTCLSFCQAIASISTVG
jgi:hypothetical protein